MGNLFPLGPGAGLTEGILHIELWVKQGLLKKMSQRNIWKIQAREVGNAPLLLVRFHHMGKHAKTVHERLVDWFGWPSKAFCMFTSE